MSDTRADRPSAPEPGVMHHFIRELVAVDNQHGRYGGRVVTRFPPEPNGYPHIGHAKSITLNFGLAAEFGGRCHLRYDDTNPDTEDPEYVAAIERDVRWLGFDPGPHIYFASDYYPQLFAYAQELIRRGRAYVCGLSEEEIRATRGTVTEPGVPSPYRSRDVEESLRLFEEMRRGVHPEGSYTLRGRIDMASPNMKMRDPLFYRIKHTPHYRSGDAWHVYPFYDFAHCLSDAIEGITHSICTLEFENNRELYDWILAALEIPTPPRQIEFARLNLNHVVVSKRKLLKLVEGGWVRGWDDPRLPTLSGLRRRGVRPEAIRMFCEKVGVARANSSVDLALFDHCVREDLEAVAPRRLAVLRPLKVVITDWPADRVEILSAPSFVADGTRDVAPRPLSLGRELYLDREDFMEHPSKGFFRLVPGGEVRLRFGPLIRCAEVVRDAAGEVVELRVTHDPASFSGQSSDGRKVKGIVHWVNAADAVAAEFRLYDRLFRVESPGADTDFLDELNPEALVVCSGFVEPAAAIEPGRYQFERVGYFAPDPDGSLLRPIYNRVVALKDSWKELRPPATAVAAPRTSSAVAATPAAARVLREASGAEAALVERGIGPEEARVLVTDPALLAFVDEVWGGGSRSLRAVASLVVNQLRPELEGAEGAARGGLSGLRFGAAALAELVDMLESGRISTPIARKVLAALLARGGSAEAILAEEGLTQLDAGAVEALADTVLTQNPAQVARFRGGQSQLLGFFVGQALKASGGRAEPTLLRTVLERKLLG